MIQETHTAILPHLTTAAHFHWRSIEFVAKMYNKSERQIRRWCVNGLFARRGNSVYKDVNGRWWIGISDVHDGHNLL